MSSSENPYPSERLCPEVRGQDLAREFLGSAIASGRIAHAYLLVGPEGVGKRLFADGIARALLCPRGGEGEGEPSRIGPCGTCSVCAVSLANHPGYRLVDAPIGSSIEITAVREVINALSLRAGSRRIVIIDGADQLGEAAANAFLKTLEEPAPGIVFLLVTSRPAHLLDTIHSRTQRVPFVPLDEPSFAAALGPIPEGASSVAAMHRASGGSPGVASRILGGIESCGGMERFGELLRGVGGDRPGALIDYLPARPKETARSRVHRLLELVLLGLWGEREADPDRRGQTTERSLLIAELIRGLSGGRSVELTLEVLARILRNPDLHSVEASLPESFFTRA